MAVSLQEYKKALKALNLALIAENNDITRDASIRRFELCVELAWKTAKKIMGTSTSAPKQVIREMAQNNLIDDVEFWLNSIDQRNLSSHTYNESLANQVYDFAKIFLPKGQALLAQLEQM